MKKPIIVFLALWICQQLPAQSQAWVRQTVLGSALVYDIPINGTLNKNAFNSMLPIGDQGSLFQLFASGTAWDTNIYLLDSKLLYTYSPAAGCSITSEDSYVRGTGNSCVYRTRADRPIDIRIGVSGLVDDGEELAEKCVYYACSGVKYDSTTYSSLNQPTRLLHESTLGNCNKSVSGVYHELDSASPSHACGEQSYKFIRYESDGVPATILTEPKVEIWPVATATIENIEHNKLYIDRLPAVIVKLKDLYPDSCTHVQIYKGTEALGKVGTVVEGTKHCFGRHYNPDLEGEPTNVPQCRTLSIPDLSNYANRDGTYTLEVITETPFFNRAPERLINITFSVDRTITTRGRISSSEKP